MDIPVGVIPPEKQVAFLDHLNAALRKRTTSTIGFASVGSDGAHQAQFSGEFKVGDQTADLSWTLTLTASNEVAVSVELKDAETSSVDWRSAATELVTTVLAAAFAERQQSYFGETMFFYLGPQLDGEYWLPGFRVAPAFPADPIPYAVNTERVVSIAQDISAVDAEHASDLIALTARRHAARMSLILNIGLHGVEHAHRWVVPVIDGVPAEESVRVQLGFHRPKSFLPAMPNKGVVCEAGKSTGDISASHLHARRCLSLPRETRGLLRAINAAPAIVQTGFDACARLYQVAAISERQFPSVGLAYRVAAVEAAAAADVGRNKFSVFMRKHVRSVPAIERELDYLYGTARSGHFHGGEFPVGEFDRRSGFSMPFMDPGEAELSVFHRRCVGLMREAIINWALTIPDPAQALPASGS